ncbi:uncharacterized protein LOC110268901 isoform X3 [Arachis ipaensis]|uniref:uncharacterized protein LOC110268901 isoform X3 n=1 Tax=Arachis ipaensis TaxID=130454 RepID=UPI000A2B72EB|nr:uncharacterized protein LOC110268901 isoform X3 [Arachis ipaensis]
MKPPPCLLSRSAEKELSLPLLENSAGTIAGVRSPLLLEVAAGLLPNRFRDRRCFGLAVLSSVRVVEIVEKASGAELLVAVTSG